MASRLLKRIVRRVMEAERLRAVHDPATDAVAILRSSDCHDHAQHCQFGTTVRSEHIMSPVPLTMEMPVKPAAK